MSNKLELVITALQQRIGEIVVNYETQIALLRAELTIGKNNEAEKENYSKMLDEKLEGVNNG